MSAFSPSFLTGDDLEVESDSPSCREAAFSLKAQATSGVKIMHIHTHTHMCMCVIIACTYLCAASVFTFNANMHVCVHYMRIHVCAHYMRTLHAHACVCAYMCVHISSTCACDYL